MQKLRLYVTVLLMLAISPVFVPAVILYTYRIEAINFYKDAFLVLTFKDHLMKDKK